MTLTSELDADLALLVTDVQDPLYQVQVNLLLLALGLPAGRQVELRSQGYSGWAKGDA